MMIFDLKNYKKSETDPLTFQNRFLEIRNNYENYCFVFTDGSKDGDKVGCAAVLPEDELKCRLSSHASIYTAELNAIILALENIQQRNIKYSVICSDSLSSLQAIQSRNFKNPLVVNIFNLLSTLHGSGHFVHFCWVPGHSGIQGNEKADSAAKSSLTLPITNFNVPFTDLKCFINQYIRAQWQRTWNAATENKLHAIKPKLGEWPSSCRLVRREEVILSRLRIGHSYFTNSYLLKREVQPECVGCHCPLTVKHILLECVEFDWSRQHHFDVDSLSTLFQEKFLNSLFAYLKEIGLYYKI